MRQGRRSEAHGEWRRGSRIRQRGVTRPRHRLTPWLPRLLVSLLEFRLPLGTLPRLVLRPRNRRRNRRRERPRHPGPGHGEFRDPEVRDHVEHGTRPSRPAELSDHQGSPPVPPEQEQPRGSRTVDRPRLSSAIRSASPVVITPTSVDTHSRATRPSSAASATRSGVPVTAPRRSVSALVRQAAVSRPASERGELESVHTGRVHPPVRYPPRCTVRCAGPVHAQFQGVIHPFGRVRAPACDGARGGGRRSERGTGGRGRAVDGRRPGRSPGTIPAAGSGSGALGAHRPRIPAFRTTPQYERPSISGRTGGKSRGIPPCCSPCRHACRPIVRSGATGSAYPPSEAPSPAVAESGVRGERAPDRVRRMVRPRHGARIHHPPRQYHPPPREPRGHRGGLQEPLRRTAGHVRHRARTHWVRSQTSPTLS